jgi:hypothetical protein
MTPNLAIVYLIREQGGGWPSIERFIKELRTQPKLLGCEIVFVIKGLFDADHLSWIRQVAKEIGVQCFDLPDDGYDWGAYIRVAAQVHHEWLLLLNTHSEPKIKNWLTLYSDLLRQDNIELGAVSSTASMESHVPYWDKPLTRTRLGERVVQRIWRILSSVFFRARKRLNYSEFPNPHLRSNALMLRRQDFLDYASTCKFPVSKDDVLKMESGRSSLTRFLLGRYRRLVVLDCNGKAWESHEWAMSETFRSGTQKNLLIADNQTRAYQNSNARLQASLSVITWGVQK